VDEYDNVTSQETKGDPRLSP